MRISQGGHDVPTEKLKPPFSRTLANLHQAIRELSHVLIYDNSDLAEPVSTTRDIRIWEANVSCQTSAEMASTVAAESLGKIITSRGRRSSMCKLAIIWMTILIVFLGHAPLRAWNDRGHMLIALLSYRQLDNEHKAKVDQILTQHPHYELFLANNRPEGVFRIRMGVHASRDVARFCAGSRSPSQLSSCAVALHQLAVCARRRGDVSHRSEIRNADH